MMGGNRVGTIIGQLRRLAGPVAGGLADADLLERFVARRDEAAFEVLLWRHGPMVLGVCRRVLRQEQDAEDAFQATFLALVKKAASIGRREAVGSWLHQVAFRAALEARARRQRRMAREKTTLALAEIAAAVPKPPLSDGCLDAEISRLPEKYRAPFILCYLEGKTTTQTARELSCPRGTVATRLAWARQRLRIRLGRRGVEVPAVIVSAGLAASAHAGLPPAALVGHVLARALPLAGGESVVSGGVAGITDSVLRAMLMSKLKLTAVIILGVVLTGAGVGVGMYESLALAPAADGQPMKVKTEPLPAEAMSEFVHVASPRDGTIAVIGTEVGKEETVGPDRLVTRKLGNKTKRYRRLRPGDPVKAGQLLVQLDDRAARAELDASQSKLMVALDDAHRAFIAEERAKLRTQTFLFNAGRSASKEEVAEAKSTKDQVYTSVQLAQANLRQAQATVHAAEAILDTSSIRSPVEGVVERILKHPDERAKRLETVLVLRLSTQQKGELPTGDSDGKARRDSKRLAKITSEQAGIVTLIGTEPARGEEIPRDRARESRIGGQKLVFRVLRVGDTVRPGLLVALLDDRLARRDKDLKQADLDAAQADAMQAVKSQEEARARYFTQERLFKTRATAAEDLRGARFTMEKADYDAASKKQLVEVATKQFKNAEARLEDYKVRSHVAGRITAILKHPGEAVRTGEPLFVIEVAKN